MNKYAMDISKLRHKFHKSEVDSAERLYQHRGNNADRLS